MQADQVRVVAAAAYTAGSEHGQGAAEHVLGIIQAATHHVAAGMVYWDAGTRHHQILATEGYSPAFLSELHAGMMDGPVFRRLLGSRAPLRFDDAAPYVFRETAVYRRTVAPAGYGDGLSAALFADGGRYVGMLHMSADSSAIFDDSIRDMIAVLGPALGGLCDPTRQTSDSLDDDFCAQIVTPHEIRAMAGRSLSPLLDAQSGIRHVAARFVESPDPTIRGLWPDRTGSWREVVLLRVRDSLHGNTGAVLVGDRPRKLPHGLSRREVDILTRLSRGASNLQIAADLCLAPRTVATHVEHILAKLDCDSRAAAASRATREGLVRLDVPELR